MFCGTSLKLALLLELIIKECLLPAWLSTEQSTTVFGQSLVLDKVFEVKRNLSGISVMLSHNMIAGCKFVHDQITAARCRYYLQRTVLLQSCKWESLTRVV